MENKMSFISERQFEIFKRHSLGETEKTIALKIGLK
jgi:DNA-binding NarL/FixJ family response regulator